MLGDETDADELEAVWDLLDQDPEETAPSAEDTDRAWGALHARLASAGAVPSTDEDVVSIETARGRRIVPWARTLTRAAGVAALAVAGALAWYSVPVEHVAPAAQRLGVTLPDGSEVGLNAGSTLSHRRGFAWLPGVAVGVRRVALAGEGYFDVAEARRPFEVVAGRTRVRVLGTRFNVRARPGPGGSAPEAVDVEVEEGRVAVGGDAPSDPETEVVLEAGEAVRYDASEATHERRAVRPDRVGLWRTGGLTMVDQTLGAIAGELGLRLGVRIEVADPEARARRVSVYYPDVDSVRSILADLATQQGLQIRRTSDGWEIF